MASLDYRDLLLQSQEIEQIRHAVQRQQQLQQMDEQYMYGAGLGSVAQNIRTQPHPPTRATLATSPSLSTYRAEVAFRKLAEELPVGLLQNIRTVKLLANPLAYVVTFTGDRVEEFYNVNDFPTDADIARICLVCP